MILEMSIADEYAVWSLSFFFLQTPVSESQRGLPPSIDNQSSFERYLLPCYWALVETRCLKMDHQVTMQTKLPIMVWILSDPPFHKVGHSQKQTIAKWVWYICDWVLICHKQVMGRSFLNFYYFYSCYNAFSSKVCTTASWSVHSDQLTEDEKALAHVTDSSTCCTGTTQKWTAVTL